MTEEGKKVQSTKMRKGKQGEERKREKQRKKQRKRLHKGKSCKKKSDIWLFAQHGKKPVKIYNPKLL